MLDDIDTLNSAFEELGEARGNISAPQAVDRMLEAGGARNKPRGPGPARPHRRRAGTG